MLGCGDTLNIHGIMEPLEVFVSLADAVVLGSVTILDISHPPTFLTDNLESAAAFTFLVTLETDEVVLVGFWPRSCELVCLGLEDARMPSFLLDEHVILVITLQVVDVSINRGVPPIEEYTGFGQLRETLVGIAINHTVILVILVETPLAHT